MQKIKLRQTKVLYKPNNIKLFKGEENIDSLEIYIPTIYNDIDLSNCNVRLSYVLSDGSGSTFLIDEYKTTRLDEDCFVYSIPIDKRFTSVSGKIEIFLTITKSENEILKSTSAHIYIDEQPSGTNEPTETELDIIDQVVLISNEALTIATKVENEKQNKLITGTGININSENIISVIDTGITNYVTDNVININDSLELPFKSIELFGKSEQLGTPSITKPQEITQKNVSEIIVSNQNLLSPYTTTTVTNKGILYTVNDDMSITVSGTATEDSYLYVISKEASNKIIGTTVIAILKPNI